MILRRALHAEALKMKRTIALKMVVLAPAAVVLLTVFMASQAPFSTLRRNGTTDEWRALTRVNLQFWGLLMMPLYITLETALIAGLDHSENQWKALLARPVPRWTLYVAKLLVVMAMTAASGVVLLCGLLLAGAVLHRLSPELRFGFSIPFTNYSSTGRPDDRVGLPVPDDSALGEPAMALVLSCDWLRYRGDGD